MLQKLSLMLSADRAIILKQKNHYRAWVIYNAAYTFLELRVFITLLNTPLPVFFDKCVKWWDSYNGIVIHTTYLSRGLSAFRSYYKVWLRHILPFWFKITFRGKGFRVRKFKRNRKLTFNFGRSHWTKLWLENKYTLIIKIRRQNYVFFNFRYCSYIFFKRVIQAIKPINCYTKRGLRLKKQYIKKRFGKVSQMISSLHF